MIVFTVGPLIVILVPSVETGRGRIALYWLLLKALS